MPQSFVPDLLEDRRNRPVATDQVGELIEHDDRPARQIGQGTVLVELTKAGAVVLFEFLARFNAADAFPFEDQSEQRVLWDLEGELEKVLVEPLSPRYAELLMAARDQVRDEGLPGIV